MAEMIAAKFGKNQWEEALERAGLPGNTFFEAENDVDDAAVMRLINSTCEVMHFTLGELADIFGEYWVNEYARRMYAIHYKHAKTAREFLLQLNKVHQFTTENIPNAHPPRFEYEWKSDRILIMTYISERSLMDFLIGLIKGVGKYFNSDLEVTRISPEKVQVVFPEKES